MRRPLAVLVTVFTVTLVLATTAQAQPLRGATRPITAEMPTNLKMELSFRELFKQTFTTCEALVTAAQAEVYSIYTVTPADSLLEDVECKASPLFAYADRVHDGAHSRYTELTAGTRLLDDRMRGTLVKELTTYQGLKASVSLDVVGSLVGAIRDHQYGTAIRHLGNYNTALACSSEDTIRALDLLLAGITVVALDGGLPPAEQRECLQGTFNAALNTFDQLQYTGVSLIQEVYTRELARIRPLLVPEYPVCDLGVNVYDFATGKLVRLRAPGCPKEQSQPARSPGRRNERGRASNASPRLTSTLDATLVSNANASFLEGYLSAFADPRKFGTGACSLLRMSATDFTCLAGLECRQSNALTSVGTARAVDAVSGRLATPRGDLPAPTSLRQGNPRRFGIPIGTAEGYLCASADASRREELAHGAFGRPDWMIDPERNFFQCQVSTLFGTMQDPTTACIMSGIRALLDLAARAEYDPSVVMGGIKDPQCQGGNTPAALLNTRRTRAKEYVWGKERVEQTRTWWERTFGENKSSFHSPSELTGTEKTAWDTINTDANDALQRYVAENAATLAGRLVSERPYAVESARDTPVIFVDGLDDSTAKPGQSVQITGGTFVERNSSSPTGYFIYMDRDFANHAEAFTKALAAAKEFIADTESRRLKTEREKEEAKAKAEEEAKTEKPSEDPGPFGEETNNACTSAVGRAMQALASCGTPQKPDPAAPANGGVDPRLINPGPDGVFLQPSTLLDISACIDQYGADIQRLNGSRYGPGGCIPPLTACGLSSCETHVSSCDSWGQWTCSASLCRDDVNCCGSPSTSRGGAGGGGTTGERTGAQIDCGDGRVWNSARRGCMEGNSCPDGSGFVPGLNRCQPNEGVPGRPGPGGPEIPSGNKPKPVIPDGNKPKPPPKPPGR